MKYLEILFWKFARRKLIKDYGCFCKDSDIDDPMYKEMKTSEAIRREGRCGSCRAKETVDFITSHIENIKY